MNTPAGPCGRCECGIYDPHAMSTPLAAQIRAAAPADRDRLVPRCARFERRCLGALDLIQALEAGRAAMPAGAQRYRPSNGTEGASFVDSWCGQCERGTRRDCPILGATYAYDVDEPEYPKEWIRDSHGPRCTAFVCLGEPLPTPRCKDTADMFPEDSHHE